MRQLMIIVCTCMTAGCVAVSPALAGPGPLAKGFSVRVGSYEPTLDRSSEFSGSYNIPGISGSFSGSATMCGETESVITLGLAYVSRRASGLDFRFAYDYRQESDMVYTSSTSEGGSTDIEPSEWPYSLHRVVFAWPYGIEVVADRLDLCLGFGLAAVFVTHPRPEEPVDDSQEDYIEYGASVFPLVGAEFYMGDHFSISAEYQYHLGRTLNETRDYSNSYISYSENSHLSLSGSRFETGLTYYF
ncbi:MAG: hypothetical protein KAY32_09770 [Candidatus Eisenbacteria sp.]|nr:hypothetical protein [Candidatus Eisenbacteria bacterium]